MGGPTSVQRKITHHSCGISLLFWLAFSQKGNDLWTSFQKCYCSQKCCTYSCNKGSKHTNHGRKDDIFCQVTFLEHFPEFFSSPPDAPVLECAPMPVSWTYTHWRDCCNDKFDVNIFISQLLHYIISLSLSKIALWFTVRDWGNLYQMRTCVRALGGSDAHKKKYREEGSPWCNH